MFDIFDLTAFFILVLMVMYWWRISEQKVCALDKVRHHCDDRNVQLLDQTLVFKEYRRIKDSNQRKHLCRIYEFDFSTDSEDRFKGEITLAGYTTIRIVLESHQVEITDY